LLSLDIIEEVPKILEVVFTTDMIFQLPKLPF